MALSQDSLGYTFAGGSFTSFNGAPRYCLTKLTPSGAVDVTFDPGTGPNSTVSTLLLAISGSQLVIGGSFTSYNGTTARYLAKVNATTGLLDPSFAGGNSGPNAGVRAIVQQDDGKCYIGGEFTQIGTTTRNYLARLNSDGSLDSSFVPPVLSNDGAPARVSGLALQNGKLLVSGYFSTPRNNILRLKADGSLDTTFDSGTGAIVSPTDTNYFAAIGATMAIQPDGKLLLGGTFNQYNGARRTPLVRLTDSKLTDVRITSVNQPDSNHLLILGLGAPNATYFLQASPDLNPANYTLLADVTTGASGLWQYSDSPASGVTRHFYRLARP